MIDDNNESLEELRAAYARGEKVVTTPPCPSFGCSFVLGHDGEHSPGSLAVQITNQEAKNRLRHLRAAGVGRSGQSDISPERIGEIWRPLEEIGTECGTDKAAALGVHDYCHTYDQLFTPLRDEPIVLLELGWGGYNDPRGGGASAAMWREYFTKADINIIDVEPKICAIPGVRLFCGSQDDRDFLAEVHAQTGDFDVVIDDASHESFRTMKSFSLLWPRVKPGGFYVVEDLHVQEAAVKRFTRLAEDHLLLHDEDVEWISFHHELVIIRKK